MYLIFKDIFISLYRAHVKIKITGKAGADGTHELAVLERTCEVYEDFAKHLHMQVTVEHLNEAIIRHSGVWLKEHQCDFSLGRKHGLPALRFLLGYLAGYGIG